MRPLGSPVPDAYHAIFPPLLTPTFWERSGNVPALVRLVQAYLARAGGDIVPRGYLQVRGECVCVCGGGGDKWPPGELKASGPHHATMRTQPLGFLPAPQGRVHLPAKHPPAGLPRLPAAGAGRVPEAGGVQGARS